MRGISGHRQVRRVNILMGAVLLPLVAGLLSCQAAPKAAASSPTAAAAPTLPHSREVARASIVAITAVLHEAAEVQQKGLNGARLAAAVQGSTRSVGTGFAVAAGGYILTAEHVIADARSIWVTTSTGEVCRASVVSVNRPGDLALLKAEGVDLRPLPIAVRTPQPGESVYTYGNPAGRGTDGNLVAGTGKVMELQRNLRRLSAREGRAYAGMIESAMPITPGDSGGPLLDADGFLIGMNAAAVLPTAHHPGRGYAFPIDQPWRLKVATLLAGR